MQGCSPASPFHTDWEAVRRNSAWQRELSTGHPGQKASTQHPSIAAQLCPFPLPWETLHLQVYLQDQLGWAEYITPVIHLSEAPPTHRATQETVSELQTKSFLIRQLCHTSFQLCLLQLKSFPTPGTIHLPPCSEVGLSYTDRHNTPWQGFLIYPKTPYLNVHIPAGAEKTFQKLANPKAIAPQPAKRHAESSWGTIPHRPSKTPLYTARRLLSLPPARTAQSLEHVSLQVRFNFSRIYFSLFKHLQVIYRSGHHFPRTMTKQIFQFFHYFQAFPVISQTAGVL